MDRPMTMKDCRGVSFYVVIGRWGGIGGGIDGEILRVTLGWIGLGFAGHDLEAFWGFLARRLQKDGLVPPDGDDSPDEVESP